MTLMGEIDALTDRVDWRAGRAEGSALTDVHSWEDLKHSPLPRQSSRYVPWSSFISGTRKDIPQIYSTPSYGIVFAVLPPSGFTSFEDILPEIRHTVSDRGERAWTAEVSPEERHTFEGSTIQSKGQIRMDSYIEALFEAATQDVFEDGMDSEFSKELTRLVRQYGNAAIDVMAYLTLSGTVNVEVTSEALRSLGEIHHPQSHMYRLRLLEKGLGSSSCWVRDGAVLGLAFLNDPLAIPHLRKAVQQEQVEELREDMGKVLSQLERTRLCRSL